MADAVHVALGQPEELEGLHQHPPGREHVAHYFLLPGVVLELQEYFGRLVQFVADHPAVHHLLHYLLVERFVLFVVIFDLFLYLHDDVSLFVAAELLQGYPLADRLALLLFLLHQLLPRQTFLAFMPLLFFLQSHPMRSYAVHKLRFEQVILNFELEAPSEQSLVDFGRNAHESHGLIPGLAHDGLAVAAEVLGLPAGLISRRG